MRPRKASENAELYASAASRDPAQIDALYGLEPVYEPGMDPRQRPLDQWLSVDCPHCWQAHPVQVDLCLPRQSLIEDCQHCCHSMQIQVSVDEDGAAVVHAERLA